MKSYKKSKTYNFLEDYPLELMKTKVQSIAESNTIFRKNRSKFQLIGTIAYIFLNYCISFYDRYINFFAPINIKDEL